MISARLEHSRFGPSCPSGLGNPFFAFLHSGQRAQAELGVLDPAQQRVLDSAVEPLRPGNQTRPFQLIVFVVPSFPFQPCSLSNSLLSPEVAVSMGPLL